MATSRRQFILCAGAAGLACSAAVDTDVVTPEMFGAKGDGRTNDTKAFAALSAHINAAGGGTVALRRTTYIVGEQSPSGPFAFSPSDILHFVGCTRPVVIRGNGAILRCAPGLRYGGFSRSGEALPDSRLNLKLENRAVPYIGMIFAEKCSGLVDISNLELDGNLSRLDVGGRYSKTGWQAATSGLRLIGNSGPERISEVRSHDHAQDGMLFTAQSTRTASTVISDCVTDENGRDGLSVTGGVNYLFQRCKSRRNATGIIRSGPAAGIDIEAESPPIRNLTFADCEFIDNLGRAFVAASGTSSDISCTGCRFVGSSNWSLWPNKPGFRFSNCLIVGQMVNVFGDLDPSRAAQFVQCTFTDDPAFSPSGKVFLGNRGLPTIAVLLRSQNVLFDNCNFRLVANGLLPQSQSDVIYSDCNMSQSSPQPSLLRGTFIGTNRITGNAHLEGSLVHGTVTLNGRPLPRTN